MINRIVLIFILTFSVAIFYAIYTDSKLKKDMIENPEKYAACQHSYKDIGGEEFECIECYSKLSNQYGITCDFSKPRG